jgi:hypothetical protein
VHKIWAWPSMITSGFGMAKGCQALPQHVDGCDRAWTRRLLHRSPCGSAGRLVSVMLLSRAHRGGPL